MKVLKNLRRTLPKTIPRSSLRALEKLPPTVLSNLHTLSDWDSVTQDEKLKDWLHTNAIPMPQATVSSPLFYGTLVFAQVIFIRANQPDFSMSLADTQTAASYATLAVVPIRRYASQYGPSSVTVSPSVIPVNANLNGNSFTQAELEGWVEQVAQIARSNQVFNPCVVILHDRSLPATPTYTDHKDSYHWNAPDGTPYCYSLVFGQNLSVADNNHTINNRPNDKVYAHNLSHEIAEMVVDPLSSSHNPEVCDACAGNCNNIQFDLFDQNGVFMGGTTDTTLVTGFSFFINSIINPSAYDPVTQCVIQGGNGSSACIYPPPQVWQHLSPIPGHTLQADLDCSGLPNAGRSVSVGDVDGDGRAEVIVQIDAAHSGANDFWVMKFNPAAGS
jgi:FG-GAP repeat